LADLVPTNIGIVDIGGDQLHCVTVENIGRRPPHDTSALPVYADRQLVATFDVPVLGVGQTTQRCIARSNLPVEEHMLTFRVDEADAIEEINERNNTYQHRIPALKSA
jgi:subtilase family serine protease